MKLPEPELLIEAVRKIAAERPGVRYGKEPGGKCLYDAGECSDDSLGCLIGQALRELNGGDLPRNFGDGKMISYLYRLNNYHPLPTPQLEWLHAVQTHQDEGDTWQEAVQYADEARPFS